MPGSSSSHTSLGLYVTFLQCRLLSSSTSSVHVCRPIAGTTLWCGFFINLVHLTGVGTGKPLGGSLLDNPTRGIKILSRTDQLQLEHWMYWPLQVHQACTQVLCIMGMFGRLLDAIRNLYI